MAVGSGQDTDSAGLGPIVICCAVADRAAIEAVVRDLEAQGHTVVLVSGVERDRKRLVAAIERCGAEGLYVLCRTAALGRDVADELRDVLLAHHIPFGRTVTVTSTRTPELLERITAGLQKLAGERAPRVSRMPIEGRFPALPRRTTQYGMPFPELVRAAKPPEPPRRVRHATQLGIPVGPPRPAAATDDLPTLRIPRAGPTERPGLDDFEEPEETSVMRPQEAQALAAADRAAAAAQATQDGASESDASTGRDEALAAEDSLANVSLITPEDLADLGHTGPFERIELSPQDVEIDDEDPNALDPTPTEVPPAPPIAEPPVAPTPSPSIAPTTPIASARTAPTMGDPEAATAPARPEQAARPLAMWVGVGLGVMTLGITGSLIAAWGEDDDAVASAPSEPAASVPGAARKDEAETAEDEPPAETPQAPVVDAIAPGQVQTRVMEALRSRKVRALDILLVAPGADTPMLHAEAVAHCEGLTIEGIDGWRLPTLGELTSMMEAQMLGGGYYWSSTAADTFGDTHWSWFGRRGRPVQRSAESLVVCVRGEPAAG